VLRGDRPFAFGLAAVLALLAVMAVGPLQSFTAAAERVDALTATRDQLRTEVDRLEDRRERLHDPEELEQLAREQLGMVRPGEIPFVVVSPDQDDRQVTPGPAAMPPPADAAWYERLWQALRGLFAD
jgi:cell division protein FtsB